MAYNILGITPGHNGSATLVSDGEVIFYLEEERLSRIKYDSNPLRSLIFLLTYYDINELVITGVNDKFIPKLFSSDIYSYILKKYQYGPPNTHYFYNQHHLTHASNTFYNSGFDKAGILVIDTAGSDHFFNKTLIQETESIYSFEYPNLVKTHYKSYNTHSKLNYKDNKTYISANSNLSKTYESITQLFKWSFLESGKTMGLSSYGQLNKNIPKMFIDGKGNPKHFKSVYGKGAIANFNLEIDPKEWHHNPSKITQFEKDLAYHIQIESEEEVFKLVEKTLDLTKLDKIACSGGYFLNCVCNYKLLKKFPNVKFYFEPTSNDGGNSIGASLYRWYEYSKDTTIRPRKTLYNGPQYSKEQLLEGIKKYV